MKKNLFFLMAIILLMSCNSGTKNSGDNAESIKTVTISEISDSPEQLTNSVVSVSGIVSHVCEHGGQKMFLTDSSRNFNLKVEVGESIPEFDIALEGSNVEVIGKLIASTVIPEEEEHSEGEAAEKEDCETETQMTEQADSCKANITYHIVASSFKEIVN
jgi:hypothetical protein